MPATRIELPDGNVDVAVVNPLDVLKSLWHPQRRAVKHAQWCAQGVNHLMRGHVVERIQKFAPGPQVTLAFRSFAGYRRAFAEYRMTLKVPFGSMAPVDQPREQRRWNLK
jgi:hypothetical protein